MRGRSTAAGLAALVVAAGAVLASTAGAVEELISFQELEDGVYVTDQYGGRGVRFGTTPTGAGAPPPQVSELRDGNKVADISRCPAARTCTNTTTATFTVPTSRIRLSVASADLTDDGVELIGLDEAGAELASTRGMAGADFEQLPELTAPSGRSFSGFTLKHAQSSTTEDRGIVFDDLSFDRPDPEPTPEPEPGGGEPATPPPGSGDPPAPAEPASASIVGPESVKLGEKARFGAQVSPAAVRHEWDLDGDGTYERNTGEARTVDHVFTRGGAATIRLRALLADGRLATAERTVAVQRPAAVAIEFAPANPKPGQKIRFKLDRRTEKDARFGLYAWRIDGVKPLRSRLKLGRTGRKRARSSALRTPPRVFKLKGAQPTLKPKLTRSLPKRGIYRVEVTALGADGSTTKVTTSIGVGDGRPPGPRKAPADDGIFDCATGKYESEKSAGSAARKRPQKQGSDPGFTGPCAAIGFHPSTSGSGRITRVSNASSDAEICYPVNATRQKVNKLATYQAKKDLVYPAPEQHQATGASASGGKARTSGKIENRCQTAESRLLSVDFDDGTTLKGTPDAPLENVQDHRYAEAGTYTVEIVAEIPYFLLPPGDPRSGAGARAAGPKFKPKSFKARISSKLTVVDPHCPPAGIKLNGVPFTTVESEGAPDLDYEGCFLPRPKMGDEKKTVYEPFDGYELVSNKLRISSTSTDVYGRSRMVIDPVSEQVYPWPTDTSAQIQVEHADHGRVALAPALEVEKPQYDSTIGRFVTPLPAHQGGIPLGGLEVVSQQAFLSSDLSQSCVAPVRVWTKLPPPVVGETPPALTGGCPLGGAAAADASPDGKNKECGGGLFSVDLSQMNLGFVDIKELVIEFRPERGWCGSARLGIPALGVDVDAPYQKRPAESDSPPDRCLRDKENAAGYRVDGPSGLDLTPTGDFRFGGFAIIPSGKPNPLNLGFAEINCISVSGETNPFRAIGKVGLQAPVGDNPIIFVDACVFYADAKKDEVVKACSKDEKAAADMVWFHAEAGLRIEPGGGLPNLRFGEVGYFDVRSFAEETRVTAGGHLSDKWVGIGMSLDVEGNFVTKKNGGWGFDLYAGGSVCLDLGFLGEPCGRAEGMISSKGLGVCIVIGGAKYLWGDALPSFFLGCDLKQSDLTVTTAWLRPATIHEPDPQLAQFGGTMVQEVQVKDNYEKAGFQIRGTAIDRSPKVKISGPGGRVIVDDGSGHQGFTKKKGRLVPNGPVQIVRTPRHDLLVTVHGVKKGTWKIEAQPGSPAIQSVQLGTYIPKPKLDAKKFVNIGGGERKLVFDAQLAPGDKLRIVEEGATTARVLDPSGEDGKNVLEFETGLGSPGSHKIYGIVERNGLPLYRRGIETFKAPAAKTPPPPKTLDLDRTAGGLAIDWANVKYAERYDLVVKFDDGRVMRFKRPNSKKVRIPYIEPDDAAVARLVAITKHGVESKRATEKLAGKAQQPAVIAP